MAAGHDAAGTARAYLVLAALSAGLLLAPLEVAGQSAVPEGYQLVFSDEFTNLSLDPACTGAGTWGTYWCRWNVRHLSGNNDQALKADPEFRGSGGPTLADHGLLTHERTTGNTLKLYGHALPEELHDQYYGFPYVAGMISSERTHAQTYGYWEVRARLSNTSKGQHWALWLVPEDGSWPPEIDMVEVVGLDPNLFHMNAHGTGRDELVWFAPDDPTGWHTFGLLWTPEDLTWFVDGVERKRIANHINHPLHLLLTPEIGGNWAGSPDASTEWPMEAEIDYVRVYEAAGVPDVDDSPPTVPDGLVATAVSSSEIDLAWRPSDDDTAVSRYDVHRGSSLRGATTDTSFKDTGLAAGTAYNYRIRACDAAENCSSFSQWASATTEDAPPPEQQGVLEITDVGVRNAWKCSAVVWITSEPADGLVEYGTAPDALSQSVYEGALQQEHHLLLSGLTRKTMYYYHVVSIDEEGDVATSAVRSFRTLPNTRC